MLNDFTDLINSHPLLVKFSASWCGPCRQLQKEIDELREKEGLLFLEIDIERYPSLAQKLNVASIPALFLFYQGKLKKNNQDYWKIRKEFSHLSLLEQLKEFVKI
jgi:thioredoxin 1